MVQSGVNSVSSGMMVGRPGSQQQTPGQGSLGNPSSKISIFNSFNFLLIIRQERNLKCNINRNVFCIYSGTNE